MSSSFHRSFFFELSPSDLLRSSLLLSLFVLFAGGSPAPCQAQSTDPVIDVQHYTFSLRLNDADNSITGKTTIKVQFVKDAGSFTLDLVRKNAAGKGMTVGSVKEDSRSLRFTQDSQTLLIYTTGIGRPASGASRSKMLSERSPSGASPAKAGSVHTYTIAYEGVPADGLIISTNKFGHRTFFGDNWPNRAHNWLPCIDNPSDKATVDFIVTAPDHYQVVSNGREEEDTLLPDQTRRTHWHESAPLYTSLMVIGVADFAIDHTADVQGIPIYDYVFPENKSQGFRDYAIAAQILPFYIQHVGAYAYEKLANVQSKTIFGGMENASAIFYFENSVGDKGIESLMAHEIAHQWFGDAVTETGWQHLWLSEGFASYMTWLYMENKYGRDTLNKGMAKDRKAVLAFEKKRFTPVVDTTVHNNYMQLLNANSYQKGSWVLHMLRRRVGDSIFWKGLAGYFAAYRNGNANTGDFEKAMETAGGQDLQSFFRQWLYTAGHPSLRISRSYDPDKKWLDLQVEQKQGTLFEFPLEFSVDGVLHTLSIKDKITRIQIPLTAPPSAVVMDPNINLLADFEISEAKINTGSSAN